jgi:hypothetical protein
VAPESRWRCSTAWRRGWVSVRVGCWPIVPACHALSDCNSCQDHRLVTYMTHHTRVSDTPAVHEAVAAGVAACIACTATQNTHPSAHAAQSPRRTQETSQLVVCAAAKLPGVRCAPQRVLHFGRDGLAVGQRLDRASDCARMQRQARRHARTRAHARTHVRQRRAQQAGVGAGGRQRRARHRARPPRAARGSLSAHWAGSPGTPPPLYLCYGGPSRLPGRPRAPASPQGPRGPRAP